MPLPNIELVGEGKRCHACKKGIDFLFDLQKELLQLFYTINMTCHEDRMDERISIRCRRCGTWYHWYFARELRRSLDAASVSLKTVHKKDPKGF